MRGIVLFVLTLGYVSQVFARTPSIIPLPKEVSWDTTFYTIPVTNNSIVFTPGAEKAALWLGKLLSPFAQVNYTQYDFGGNWIVAIDASLQSTLGEEGYTLDITNNRIKVRAATDAGLFYGIQTLRQMFPADIERKTIQGDVRLQCVHITDAPAYSWRGCMIDIARRFHSYEEIKQQIDRMALYKLNRLHLHLTDDQGWRIEIKSRPNLVAIGSKSAVGGGTSGYLTQQQYLDLQDYAMERHIIIIPEIDMPGHTYAALASYTDLNCSGNSNLNPIRATPPQLYTGVEVGWSALCLSKSSIYNFVEDVIGEIAGLTKGPWIHIGGDEIKDGQYGEFINKAEAIVIKNHKIMIGWEEVLAHQLDPSSIGQLWMNNTSNTINKNIISLCGTFYFDHGNVTGQPNTADWCTASVTLEKVYGFQFTSVNANALGIEGALWTERVEGASELDNRLWPRMIAVAEVTWTPQAQRNTTDFIDRIGYHGDRLDNMGCNFYITPTVNWRHGTASNPGSVFYNYKPNLNDLNTSNINNNNKAGAKLQLYPNPANMVIYLGEFVDTVKLYDFTGKQLSEYHNVNFLNIDKLRNGIYFINSDRGSGQFVIER